MIKRWLQEGTPRQRITELEAQVAQLTAERDAAQKECQRLSDYSVELLNARVRFEHEAIGLKIKLDEAVMAREIRQSRTRKKPLAKAE